MEKPILNLSEICAILGIGKTRAYKMINDGESPSGRIGGKIIVRSSDLDNYISKTIKSHAAG